MAQGNEIVVSANARGRKKEGILNGALQPGVCVEVSAGVEPVSGEHDWSVFNAAADGDQRLVTVLDRDHNQGKLATAAYVDNDRCFLYCPLPGDELNMLVANIAGTGDTFAIGDILMIDDGTGKLIATTGSPESESFIVMETIATALTVDTLVHCMFTGY